MSAPLWSLRVPPETGFEAAQVGRWQPVSPSDVTVDRRDLASALRLAGGPAGADGVAVEDAIDRLLLAYEELASNALRHGRDPVSVTVTAFGVSWLLDVSDAAPDRPPTPALDRDPADGGLGLYLVACLCSAHGVAIEADRKHVWARIDIEAPQTP